MAINPILCLTDFPHHNLCCLGIIPKVWITCAFLLIGKIPAPFLNVEVFAQSLNPLAELLDFF